MPLEVPYPHLTHPCLFVFSGIVNLLAQMTEAGYIKIPEPTEF